MKPTPARILIFALLTVTALFAYSLRGDLSALSQRLLSQERSKFEAAPFPYRKLTYLYDMGVVDANGDGQLDLYTANHNYRQVLLLADGRGGFHDVLSAWGLDQSRALPGSEQAREAPQLDRPGLYIYWQGDVLHLVAHRTEGLAPIQGAIRLYNTVEIVGREGFDADVSTTPSSTPGGIAETLLSFKSASPGHLRLYLSTRGAPVHFDIDAPWAADHVYVGAQRVTPAAPQHFELALLDRHALTWADYNDDGQLDVFINRGALGGTLRRFPAQVRQGVGDELLLSEGPGRFADQARALGIEKKDCSGRHARWVDFDRDGRLDLYINCQDRGKVAGSYSKQFYRQEPDHRLSDIAAAVGLALPEHQIVDLVWFDVDGDGWVDLFTHEDTGYYVYRNRQGRFERSFVARGPFHRADVVGLTGETTDYWQFDGKLSVADFDADGDLDVFMASKKGNGLLINDGGRFKYVPPATLGLPRESVAAQWVDYDNDGRMDLHTVPQGLYRQGDKSHFVATGMFRLLDNKYQAAIINWFDRDNDGRLDLVMALQDNATLWRWWEKPFKHNDVKGEDDRFDWAIQSYRNIGPGGHWLQVALQGQPGNRQAIGAQVTVTTQAGRQTAQVGAHDGAYSSQGHYRLYFGLGPATHARLQIQWPDGKIQEIGDVAADRLLPIAYPK